MREILFRGECTETGDWVKGFYVRLYDDKGHESHRIYPGYAETDCGDYYPDFWEVDPETVGQFTGLTDKNGKKIFEGDIVRDISAYTAHLTSFERGRETKENVERYRYSGKVSVMSFETEDHGSCGCCYHAFSGSGFEAKEVDIRCCEVIGNIIDNPELLETA